jgi:hypothetical protein
MTNKQGWARNSTPLIDHQETTQMNIDSFSRLETQTREAEIRHHLEERTLELAVTRRKRQTAASGTGGSGLVSWFLGWLAPRRVATASGTATHLATPPPATPTSSDGCTPSRDCSTTTDRLRSCA